uniref:(northern house mosquito) hypothetical protein n=1 Tax=Culex pipiens TaxID=7175 RepID=A0A8D8FKX8_CULPI
MGRRAAEGHQPGRRVRPANLPAAGRCLSVHLHPTAARRLHPGRGHRLCQDGSGRRYWKQGSGGDPVRDQRDVDLLCVCSLCGRAVPGGGTERGLRGNYEEDCFPDGTIAQVARLHFLVRGLQLSNRHGQGRVEGVAEAGGH